MKKYFFYFVLISIFTHCSPSNEFKVNGTVDLDDATQVFVIKADDNNRPEPVDTLEVMGGSFSFSGNVEVPEMHYLFFEGTQGNLPFVLENGTITIKAYKDSLRKSRVTGTDSNRDFASYLKGSEKYSKDLTKIQIEMRNPSIRADSLAFTDLKEQFDSMLEKLENYELDFITNRPDSYISSLILERMVMSKSIETEKAIDLYDSFSNLVKQTKSGRSIHKIIYPDANPESFSTTTDSGIGSVAPDFKAPNPEGEMLTLKQIASTGKITLIDFWASWCGPCRVENPSIVAMYKEFNSKGLNIVGVSLDRNADSWKKAIKDDKLTWTHVSNLKYWRDPIARQYQVNSIPRTFIVDKDLNVLASGLRGNDLEKKIAELLAL